MGQGGSVLIGGVALLAIAALALAACQPRAASDASQKISLVTDASSTAIGSYPENAQPIATGFDAATGSPVLAASGRYKGVEIPVAKGARVLAADYAIVIRTGYLGDCGNMARLENTGTGIGFVYCHLNRIDVRRGQAVRPGEVIGRAGRTGDSLSLKDKARLGFVVYKAGGDEPEILPPEAYLFGASDGKAVCPEPSKIGKNAWEGGYSTERAKEAEAAGRAVLLYPACDLLEYAKVSTPKIPALTASGDLKLSSGVQALLGSYMTKPMPGAFAVSVDGRAASYNYCFVAVSRARRRLVEREALDSCRGYSDGVPCKIYAWRGKIVWDPSRQ